MSMSAGKPLQGSGCVRTCVFLSVSAVSVRFSKFIFLFCMLFVLVFTHVLLVFFVLLWYALQHIPVGLTLRPFGLLICYRLLFSCCGCCCFSYFLLMPVLVTIFYVSLTCLTFLLPLFFLLISGCSWFVGMGGEVWGGSSRSKNTGTTNSFIKTQRYYLTQHIFTAFYMNLVKHNFRCR